MNVNNFVTNGVPYARSMNELTAFVGTTFTRISGKQLLLKGPLLTAATGGFLNLAIP